MWAFWKDLVIARRSLSRQAGLWVFAVIALAGGVGVNTTAYAFLRSIFERPFEVLRQPGTVIVMGSGPGASLRQGRSTLVDFDYLREHSQSFRYLAAYTNTGMSLGGDPGAERVDAVRITEDFFRIPESALVQGRWFEPTEYRPGGHRVAILSHGLWERRFHSEPTIVGKAIRLDGETFTVVGVAGPRVWYPSTRTDLWAPMPAETRQEARVARGVRIFGVLNPGVTRGHATAEFAQMNQELARRYPESHKGWMTNVFPVEETFSPQDNMARTLLTILAVLVLLLACVNVANLLLVRAVGRRREMAIRKSLGASLSPLVRQALAEGLLLAVPACLLALLLADASAVLLLKEFPGLELPIPENAVDYRVLLMACGAALVAVLAFSIAPVLDGWGADLQAAIHSGNVRAGVDRRQRKLTAGFVVLQAALAMALVSTAAYVARGMHHGLLLGAGYPMENAVELRVALARSRYPDARQALRFYQQAEAIAASAPGVASAGAVGLLPSLHGNGFETTYSIPSSDVGRAEELPRGAYIPVTPSGFATLRIPLRRGRPISVQDQEHTEPVALINETGARVLWPNGDAIGQPVRLTRLKRVVKIIGVTQDVRPDTPTEATRPQFFVPATQEPLHRMVLVARTVGPAEPLVEVVRRAVQPLDPEEPLVASTLEADLYEDLKGGITFSRMLGVIGGLALFLAGVGLFSLLAYQVWASRQEIGVRMALGARPDEIRRGLLLRGAKLSAIGLALGILGYFGLASIIEPMLYGIRSTDSLALGGSVSLLLAVAFFASLVPARRAARVEPMIALRQD